MSKVKALSSWNGRIHLFTDGQFRLTASPEDISPGEYELSALPPDLASAVTSAINLADEKAKAEKAADEKAADEAAQFTLLRSSWKGLQKAANWRGLGLAGAIKARRPHNQEALLPARGYVEPVGAVIHVEMEHFPDADGLLSALGDYNPATKTIKATHIPKGWLIGHGGETVKSLSALVGFRVNID